jgi:hypothetical protein
MGALSGLVLRPWAWHGGGQLLVLVRIRICILNLKFMCVELLRRAAVTCIHPVELRVFRVPVGRSATMQGAD